ncbi:Hypothetical predicted protein [Mytilus galloprovincialis]|uniref:HTH psq-type domain-containing protein n=1 Tax=Mytilus galloprovincialis TaxID=29158 RepID=A0A8B6F6E7_MYTGA|nr:Hypothetical predicted protein [Mytilus galloprovincialis]
MMRSTQAASHYGVPRTTIHTRLARLEQQYIALSANRFGRFKLPVRPRSRDYKQRNYSPEALERAVEAVKSGLLTANRAAVLYGVPQRTVYNRIGKYKMSVNQNNDYVSHIVQKVIFDDK